MTYDLHIHSCLSPCAENEMTPANIAGFAKLNGIDLIAVADHNAADNLPAVQQACHAYGVQFLPAIEVNTAEEIHLLTYFPTIDVALKMSDTLYQNLPTIPYDSAIWGEQLIMDTDDHILAKKDKLLTAAVNLSIYEVTTLCEKLGGIAVPAHIDKESYSILSVLGLLPDDLSFCCYEVKRPEHTLSVLLEQQRLPSSFSKEYMLTSSDAHQLCEITEVPRTIPLTHPLLSLF